MRLDAYTLIRPERRDTSVFFSSPHSGRDYPALLVGQTILDERTLRSSEDAFVDELFARAPLAGAPLIAARVPRAYVDLNRASDELDSALIEGVSRAAHNPRVSSGLGVIPRVVANGRAIYRGKMPLMEAEARIARYWAPYHHALGELIDESLRLFGESVLVDCHSMPHEAIETHARPGQPTPEVVLGDRFGAAAARSIVDRIEEIFVAAGLRVVRNAPFAGAYIAQAYGRPSRNQHVVQIEVDRSLYMDEARVERSAAFPDFSALMAGVVDEIAGLGRRVMPLAAE